MPNVLEGAADQGELKEMMSLEDEQAELAKFARNLAPGDLSNGGMVGGVQIIPQTADGRVPRGREARLNPQGGRPSARRAWMHDGTETLLPLAYEPSGKHHDGAMHYLRKRRCLCCNTGGFFGQQCPNCVKSGCANCRGSTDSSKIIRSFYLKKEDVPFPREFHGKIDCFLEGCPRRGALGFITRSDMMVHARGIHRMEYQAHLDSLSLDRNVELDSMRQQINELLARQVQPPAIAVAAEAPPPRRSHRTKSKAARESN